MGNRQSAKDNRLLEHSKKTARRLQGSFQNAPKGGGGIGQEAGTKKETQTIVKKAIDEVRDPSAYTWQEQKAFRSTSVHEKTPASSLTDSRISIPAAGSLIDVKLV